MWLTELWRRYYDALGRWYHIHDVFVYPLSCELA